LGRTARNQTWISAIFFGEGPPPLYNDSPISNESKVSLSLHIPKWSYWKWLFNVRHFRDWDRLPRVRVTEIRIKRDRVSARQAGYEDAGPFIEQSDSSEHCGTRPAPPAFWVSHLDRSHVTLVCQIDAEIYFVMALLSFDGYPRL
jgi:hypothetical protein